MGPDLLRALLRQTVGMTEIILKTAAAEHQHLTATRVEALETLFRQQLGVGMGVMLLALVALGQRTRLYPVARLRRAVDGHALGPWGAWSAVHSVWRMAVL